MQLQVAIRDHSKGPTMFRFLESTAKQYMTSKVTSVTRACTLGDLESLFAKYDFETLPVVENGKLIGIVTKFDFLRAFTTGQLLPSYDEQMKRTVGEVMTEGVIDVASNAPLTRVLQMMVNHRIRSFPVVDDGKLVGMISRGDVMRALKQATYDGK
jgi:CBS domain-containing protein